METKFDFEKETKRLTEMMDDDDVMLAVRINEKKRESSMVIYGNDADATLSAMFATILKIYLEDEDSTERISRPSEILLNAFRLVAGSHGSAGLKLALEMAKSTISKVENGVELEDDEERCEECKERRTCPLPKAVAYRKANGIPKPRKSKKGCEREIEVN